MLDKPYIEEPDMSGLPDEEVAARTWANYRARNDSSMVDHFQARPPLASHSRPLGFPLHEVAGFRLLYAMSFSEQAARPCRLLCRACVIELM